MEQELKALCLKHGMRTISVCVWPEREMAFTVFVHPEVDRCEQGHGTTVADAVEMAIAKLRARRAKTEAA